MKYDSIRPGEVWLDTNASPSRATGSACFSMKTKSCGSGSAQAKDYIMPQKMQTN